MLGLEPYGQLGNGLGGNSSTPVDVSGLASGVTAISANALHACALTTAGQVKCWGSTTPDQASPKKTDSNVPVDVSGLGSSVAAITAGGLHACAITSGGVECWGSNGEGELGNGSRTDSDRPVEVPTLTTGVTALAVGSTDDFHSSHTCALTSAGGVKCWGPNGDGQLGNGSTTDSSRPVEVRGLTQRDHCHRRRRLAHMCHHNSATAEMLGQQLERPTRQRRADQQPDPGGCHRPA